MKLKMLLRLLLGIYSANDYIIIGRKLSMKTGRGLFWDGSMLVLENDIILKFLVLII